MRRKNKVIRLRYCASVMEVSPSGYYAWRKRLKTPPCVRLRNLKQLIRNCYFENRRRYGARRIAKFLTKSGVKIGRRKVRSLMQEENLKAISVRAFKPKTTDSKGTRAAENLLAGGAAEEKVGGKIIIGDITYIRLKGGKFCYLAVWQDKCTRRIIGWSLGLEMTAELIISALEKALQKGKIKPGAIVHSDRGSQYASNAFRALLERNSLLQSMSGKGNCYDNAQCDTFLFEI